MGKLIQFIREMVQQELFEMSEMAYTGAPRKGMKILDKGKAERLSKLHAGHYVGDLIDLIINSGDNGITRGEAAEELKKDYPKIDYKYLQNIVTALQTNGVISGDRLTPIKPEKTPGQRGRKVDPSSRTGKVAALRQKFKDDENYQPTDDDITFKLQKGFGNVKFSQEDIDQIKASALGLIKRGRPKMQKESLHEIYSRLQNLLKK